MFLFFHLLELDSLQLSHFLYPLHYKVSLISKTMICFCHMQHHQQVVVNQETQLILILQSQVHLQLLSFKLLTFSEQIKFKESLKWHSFNINPINQFIQVSLTLLHDFVLVFRGALIPMNKHVLYYQQQDNALLLMQIYECCWVELL